jgi:hypothetical protein
MEFTAAGGVRGIPVGAPALAGTYKLRDDEVLIDLGAAVPGILRAEFKRTGDELKLTAKALGDKEFDFLKRPQSKWTRVPELSGPKPAPAPPTAAELVGRWQAVGDREAYDFFADGTFARRTPFEFFVETHQGAWELTADPAAPLRLSYPDTNRVETVRAGRVDGRLALGRDHKAASLGLLREVQAFTRTGDPVADRQPVRAGVLTAYQLHREFQTDPKAAAAKYVGKEVEVAGVVRGFSSSFSFASGAGKEAKSNRQTTITLSTGEDQRVECVFPGLSVGKLGFGGGFDPDEPDKPAAKKDDNPVATGRFVRLRGRCLGVTEPDRDAPIRIGGDAPKVRFADCVLVADEPKR